MTAHRYLDPRLPEQVFFSELVDPTGLRPPAEPGVYVVCFGTEAICVGMTEKQRLRDRIGDFVANAIGLYGDDWARQLHSGGRRIREQLAPEQVLDLHVHWRANPECIRCA